MEALLEQLEEKLVETDLKILVEICTSVVTVRDP